MSEIFTPRPIQSIIDPILSELEVSVTWPLVPNPLNTTQEADFMLPENRSIDHPISDIDQEEFECDRCDSAFYRLITCQGISYACCTECGWVSQNLLVDAIATEEIKSCLKCRHLSTTYMGCKHWNNLSSEILERDDLDVEAPKHCGNFEAIASVGGAG